MTEEKQPSIDWRRIYVLPYHPLFKKDVKSVRTLLRLPENGISDEKQASAWLHDHIGLKTPYSPDSPTIPLGAAIVQSASEAKLFDTEIPLWHFAGVLAQKYGIPLRMRNHIGVYILTNDEEWLYVWNGLDVTVSVNIKAGKPQFAVIVDGIDTWTTRTQWQSVWDNYGKHIRRLAGKIPESKRNAPNPALRERIRRYAEWYELSEQPNSGPAKALREWENKHKNEMGKYDISTVTKAVKEFRRLITTSN